MLLEKNSISKGLWATALPTNNFDLLYCYYTVSSGSVQSAKGGSSEFSTLHTLCAHQGGKHDPWRRHPAQRRQDKNHSGHRLSGNMVRWHSLVSAGCLWTAVGHRGRICPAQRRGSVPAGLVPCDVPQTQLDGQPV